MITLDDCAAFCEADPEMVDEIAHREHLCMAVAFARAHGRTLCANEDFPRAHPCARPSPSPALQRSAA